MSTNSNIVNARDFLGKLVRVQVDRPLGSSSNIAVFNQTDHKLPDMSDWHRSNKWAKSTIKKIKTLHEKQTETA
ncbi:MAG: hypothetical protein IJE79_03540 [Alphaproteobacteria bacterium]|nr:hypothetical protein [Alphaproteobacteria bacterium]